MYSGWTSLSETIKYNIDFSQESTTLKKFSALSARDICGNVVKQISTNLGISQAPEPSMLLSEQDVNWSMDVICFGLLLPLNEHEIIKDCVNIYCEWLTALHPAPKISVPKPIAMDPNLYSKKIIMHLHNLFVPRNDSGPDTINRQVVLCHRVLRTLQHTAQISSVLTRDTWETILLFLLAINDILLSPPNIPGSVGDQLCERVLSVLFEVWLLACVRSFPSPSLWKTFQELCADWRHRTALIEQWNRVNLALTARLLQFMYGSSFPELKILEEDAQLIPVEMSNDCVAQTWYRFIRLIGSPSALCNPKIISHTPQFIQHILLKEESIEPHQHPCLTSLPQSFLKAMKGIGSLVDAFLGIYTPVKYEELRNTDNGDGSKSARNSDSNVNRLSSGAGNSVISNSSENVAHSPTSQRRLAKSFSVVPSNSQKGLSKGSLIGLTNSRSSNIGPVITTSPPTSILSVTQENRNMAPTQARPKCNSILHLFGEWLFEAAMVGTDIWMQNIKKQATEASRRPSSMIMDARKGLSLSQPSSLESDIPASLTIDKFESGRAEAIGALCRIFCGKKSGEDILPSYLVRFYVALAKGLKTIDKSKECEETLASILYNSADLFRLDLDGIQVLLPYFIASLELILCEKDLKIRSHSLIFNKTELRRASINILLSIISLPLHYQTLPIRDLFGGSSDRAITFIQLKPRLINILMNALQLENDPQNTHMLLGALLLIVQDSVTYEDQENPEINTQSGNNINLLSSACSERSAYSLASGTSNLSSATSSTTMSNDPTSLTISEDISEDFEANTGLNDSGHALFVRATYLCCHRLISTWKTDLNVSLAALELLSGLARLHIKDSDALESKRAVKWICDYICFQCSRPPPSHSKDLHSTIVAAFTTISAWVMSHPYLLRDKDCLNTVLEVVELGISGSKSIGKVGEPIKMKDEKEIKPVSMRVRDAAEILLTVLLEQVEYFPNECGIQSLSSLLNEEILVKHCNAYHLSNFTEEQAIQKFRYFVTENSTILAIFDEPLSNVQEPQPSVTLLFRGPFGRNAFAFELRHLPRSFKSTTKHFHQNTLRPIAMNEIQIRHEVEQKFFPDSVERVEKTCADYSIPSLDAVIQKIGVEQTKQLSKLLEDQVGLEKLAWAETESSDGLSHAQECIAPTVCHEFQAARLYLSHFGYLSFGDGSKEGSELNSPSIIALDSKKSGFIDDLRNLDKISPRTADTVYIFYVKNGQNKDQEIIENMNESNVDSLDPNFWSMLLTLGKPVDVEEHSGWTGSLSKSYNVKTGMRSEKKFNEKDFNVKRANFNGEKKILYWADVGAEIAFLVPNKSSKKDSDNYDGCCLSANSGNDVWYERSISENQQQSAQNSGKLSNQKSRALSLDFEKTSQTSTGSKNLEPVPPMRRRTATKSSPNGTWKILLVWLESYEDHLTFPLDEILSYTGTENQQGNYLRSNDCYVIFLHALGSDLLRVKLQGSSGRINFAIPLVDGMVVNKRVIGTLVRQTAYNMSRRKRLDNDSYQPPHVRRRLKVQEMIQKYKLDFSEPELMSFLFQST